MIWFSFTMIFLCFKIFDFSYLKLLLKVWFKNKRAKCRQIQKQNSTKPTETQTTTNVSKKSTNIATTAKLKVKTASTLLNNSSTSSLITETSNFIKAQNPFLIPSGSTKVTNWNLFYFFITLDLSNSFLDLPTVSIPCWNQPAEHLVACTYWRISWYLTKVSITSSLNLAPNRITKIFDDFFAPSLVAITLWIFQRIFKRWLSDWNTSTSNCKIWYSNCSWGRRRT